MIGKKPAILFCAVIILLGCQREIYNFTNEFSIPEVSKEPPLIQFVVDQRLPENNAESANLKKLSDYTKIPYQTIPLEEFKDRFQIERSTRVLVLDQTFDLADKVVGSIQNFVAKGGTLFLTKSIHDDRFAFLTGLSPDTTLELDSLSYGFRLNKPVLPGMEGFAYPRDKNPHKGLKRRNFSEKVNVLATTYNNLDYPLIIEHKLGRGKVVNYNSTLLLDRSLRGILFSQVLLGLEGIPYPIANTSTIFLDDFPAPVYNIYKEPIKSEMNKTVAEYVTDVWWPDMKKYAQEQDITYTAYVTFDYNAYVIPPYTFKEWDKNSFEKNGLVQKKSSWLGRDVYESGHELGFHGYNHVSLLEKDWEESEYMVTALKIATKKWKTLDFKEPPISYVPPSNYIDSIGLAKLKEGMPSLKYIQSVYFGTRHDGGNREFDPDPLNDYFFDYPRITSGYDLNKTNLWALESLYLFTGIWTHFVHPDDVFQIPDKSNEATIGHFEFRNPNSLNWYSYNGKKGLFDRFKDEMASFKKRHPMARFLNATESSEITMKWRYAYFTHMRDDGNYIVESDYNLKNEEKQYWFMYVSDENALHIDQHLTEVGRIKKAPFLNGNLYSLETKDAFLAVPDLGLLNNRGIESETSILDQVRADQRSFMKERRILAPLALQVEELIAEGDLKQATDLLEQRLKEGMSFTKNQWLDYATYMTWQKRGTAVWNLLEQLYQRKSTKELADMSRKIASKADYPNDQIRKKWLKRQLLWRTDDIAVLKEYYAYFNTEKEKHTILQVLKRLNALAPGQENSKNYILHLLNHNFDGLVQELNTIEPCDPYYKDMATSIAWAYADNFGFDQALAWEKCSTEIDKETIRNWMVNSVSFEKLKETDFDLYLETLLANDEKKALKVIQNKQVCSAELRAHSAKIAYTYANFNLYREALAWAHCSNDVPITSKLSWLQALKKYQKVRRVYDTYIHKHPNDHGAKLHMAALLLLQGDIKGSLAISADIPKEVETLNLREEINKRIKNLNTKEKYEVLNTYGHVLYPSVRKDISSILRMEEGNSISSNSYAINDKLDPNTISNTLSYNMNDKKFNVHSVAATQSFMYPINFVPENDINGTRNLIGIEYRVKQPSEKKIGLSGRARLERDDQNNIYYQLGLGVNFSGEKNFNSLLLEHFPVRSGPGHILGLYRTTLGNYNEFQLAPDAKQVFSFEGNYYSDQELDGIFVSRSEYIIAKNKWLSVSPLIEFSYNIGTTDRRDGFPYWMAKNRGYGGGGLVLTLGSEQSTFYMLADASWFLETSQPNFMRYTSNLNYKIKDFARIVAGLEIYTIENFNSNVFQLGLVYNFK